MEHHNRFCHLFSYFKLTYYKFVALKLSVTLFKIITVGRPSTFLRIFLWGDWGFLLEALQGRLPPLFQKFWKFPSLSDVHSPKKLSPLSFMLSLSLPWLQTTHWKKVISNIYFSTRSLPKGFQKQDLLCI